MEISSVLQILFSSISFRLPIFIALIGGIIYCVVNLSKNAAAGRKALIGLIIFFAVEVLSSFVPLLHYYFLDKFGSQNSFLYVNFFISFLLSIGFAVGLVLILAAVWTNRKSE